MMSTNLGRPVITFVVPCYNERANIGQTVEEIEIAVRGAAIVSHEIIVVDDCSTDDSQAIVRALAQQNSNLVLIPNSRNLGFGAAYKTGLQHARGIYVIMIPGDNAFPNVGIRRILSKMGTADIVVPYFAQREARFWSRRVISRAFTLLMNCLFNMRLPYFNGPVLHRADLLSGIEIKTDGFAFTAEGLIKLIKSGATYTTIGVEVLERAGGKSSALKPKNILLVAQALPRLWVEVFLSRTASLNPVGRNGNAPRNPR
jgi:glycosyltransferase involved in cell wall biosynthesis